MCARVFTCVCARHAALCGNAGTLQVVCVCVCVCACVSLALANSSSVWEGAFCSERLCVCVCVCAFVG